MLEFYMCVASNWSVIRNNYLFIRLWDDFLFIGLFGTVSVPGESHITRQLKENTPTKVESAFHSVTVSLVLT